MHALLTYYIFFVLPAFSLPASLVNGITFVDFFSASDNGIWIKEDNNIFCLDHQCFYAKKQNLLHDRIADDDSLTSSYLQFTLQNNCRGSSCCYNGACTRYTGGQITSRPLYTYGSFRYLALAEVSSSDDNYGAQTCFGLSGSDKFEMSIQIAICVSASNPWKALLHYDHSGTTHIHKHVDLPFNAGRILAMYRIDWYPRAIRFYIKGKLVGWITSSKRYDPKRPDSPMFVEAIPDAPMFITVSIIPDDMEKPDLVQSRVTVRMHLYKVQYIMWDDRHKQDLFVHQNAYFSNIIFVVIAGAACVGCFFIQWLFKGNKQMKDDYILLDDSNAFVIQNNSAEVLNLSNSIDTDV